VSYVGFADEATFTEWHDQRCLENGIPFPGRDTDGVPMLDHQWTTAYAAPVRIDGTICVAGSPEAIAEDKYLTTLPVVVPRLPVEPGSDVDENGDPISVVETEFMEYHKPLPPTWVDPIDGTEYPVPQPEE
jgi:hypothetical protein